MKSTRWNARRLRGPAVMTLLVLASIEIAARIAERATRVVEPTADQYAFYRFDPVLGWANEPLHRGTLRRAEFEHSVAINAHGMRYRDVDVQRRAGVTRVAVLGDSFTWGIGVAADERFTERAEQRLDGRAELLNFGVAGYAPIQYALDVERALAFHPDVVVLAFCLQNDFMDDVEWRRYGYYKPYARLDGDDVAIEGYPLPRVQSFAGLAPSNPLTSFLDAHSSAYRAFERIARSRRSAAFDEQRGITILDDWERELYADPATLDPERRAAVATMVEIDRRLLRRVRDRVRAAGARFAILPVVTKCELGMCFEDHGAPNARAFDALAESARSLDVPLVDTRGVLAIEDFWEKDTHWRASGHDKIGAVLAAWIAAGSSG